MTFSRHWAAHDRVPLVSLLRPSSLDTTKASRNPPAFFILWFLLLLAASAPTGAQLCSTTHTTDLYCLLPATFHTQAAPFNAIFTPFGTELSELPTARPAGLVLTFEHGVLVPSTENLGAIFTERAESLGKHRIFLGATYQNFTFTSVDGTDLKHIPIVLFFPPLQVYTVTDTRLDIRVGQYTLVAAAGITPRLDLSVSIPLERVAFAAGVKGTEYGPGGTTASFTESVPGSSSGLADIVVGAKTQVFDRKRVRLTGGFDLRLPTGDELNFLGSGTLGLRPYLAASRRGKVSPHLNLGYQWNSTSILNASLTGAKQTLPGNFFYTAGANLEPFRRWTVTADVLGRRFYNAPRLSRPIPIAIPGLGTAPSVQPVVGSYNTTDLSLGVKTQRLNHLLLTGNVTLKLDSGGLRARIVPLGGLSYSF